MTLGNPRPRNWGAEAQEAALALALKHHHVAYKLQDDLLFLAPSKNGTTLPFVESCASLVNIRRGCWEARHLFDDHVLATGVSKRDVIRATVQAVCR